jgi:putative spermidine/putrescine transport system ATP-binding protein
MSVALSRLRPLLAGGRSAEAVAPAPERAVPIDISELRVRLGAQPVLRSVDLAIRPGEFLTLLGPSGSGKTTLLMTIAGFVEADGGAIRIGGSDVTRLPPHRRDLGFVFQSYALFPHMSVGENIAYPLKLRGISRGEIAARVEQALALVQLSGFAGRPVANLSGGQRQRVAVARAVVFQPRVLLMDEPLSALDKPLREAMQLELRRLHADLGLTTIYVTHDQREALTLSDRIAVIDGGRVLQVGTPEELYERPADGFVARFLGESTVLPVTVADGRISCAGSELHLAGTAPADGGYGLLIRPERLRRVLPDEVGSPDLNVFSGIVADVIFQGDSFRVEIALYSGATITWRSRFAARVPGDLPARGDAIDVALARQDSVLLPEAVDG